MSSAPSYVAVKRKREDPPIHSLILEERKAKHAKINVEYRLESVSQSSNEPPAVGKPSASANVPVPSTEQTTIKIDTQQTSQARPAGPRQFELAPAKRSADSAGFLPTFVERPAKRAHVEDDAPSQAATPLKRPGTKGAAVKTIDTKFLGKGQEPSATLSARLHAFALEEAAQENFEEREKPRVIVQPKRPIRRRKEIPTASIPGVSTSEATATRTDEEDYVYDIYIRSTPRKTPAMPSLASLPVTSTNSTDPTAPRSAQSLPVVTDSTAPRSLLDSITSLPPYDPSYDSNVGYLILPSDSQSDYFWSASPNGSPGKSRGIGASSDEDDDDGEDSNAEDYYGADYPEDEVASDDEMGIGEWRYRRGSDDEDDFQDPGWVGRVETPSDGSEDERMMNPWRKLAR